ncbi:hypothetical protein PMAYCL1PPCAC_10532, partial [Pristionchus mayeri]
VADADTPRNAEGGGYCGGLLRCSFFTFAFDFILYNFAHHLNVIFSALLGYQPLLVEYNSTRTGMILGMVGTVIKEVRRLESDERKAIEDLARAMNDIQVFVVNSLARGLPIDQVGDLYEGITLEALRIAR